MKILLGDLKKAEPALAKVLDAEMPFKTAYRLKKLASQVAAELMHVEKERGELVKKHGTKNAQGAISVPKENLDAFMIEWNMVLDTDVEFNADLIPLAALEMVPVSPSDLMVLEPFLEVEQSNVIPVDPSAQAAGEDPKVS